MYAVGGSDATPLGRGKSPRDGIWELRRGPGRSESMDTAVSPIPSCSPKRKQADPSLQLMVAKAQDPEPPAAATGHVFSSEENYQHRPSPMLLENAVPLRDPQAPPAVAVAVAVAVETGAPGPWRAVDVDAMDGHWHYSHRSPWLRALVLGANDGLVSISSLMLGVGAVKNDAKAMVVSGLAGLVAGAGSMAIGEFVSVFSQRDTELADIEKERQEHAKGPEAQARELEELAQIYVGRGLPYYLAKQVAEELSRGDVLKAHARDELGIDVDALSNPHQAALASALAFSLGGGLPLLAGAFVVNYKIRLAAVVAVSSAALAMFGAVGARLGGAPMFRAALRVLVGGWLAMSLTYGILKVLGSNNQL